MTEFHSQTLELPLTLNILIVDDDDDFSSTLAEQVHSFGHRSTTVGGEHKALMAITDDAFDVVILDRVLPTNNGISFIHSLRQAGLTVPKTEFNLLTELVRHAGSPLTRTTLLKRVWNYDVEPATNVVDTYIKRLRKKLAEAGGDDPIITLRGIGYMLRK